MTVLVPDAIDRRMAQAPHAPAISCGDRGLTYGQLGEAVQAVADQLQDVGVGAEAIVVVALDRSIDLAVSLLAILRIGAAYLPVDPAWPLHRHHEIADTSRPAAVIGADPLVTSCYPAPVVAPADGRTHIGPSHARTGRATRTPRPDALAYVLFTSGSTGRPKGVMVEHAGLANRLAWQQAAFPIGPGDRVLHKTPPSFDVSIWELLWPLATGAEMVVVEPTRHRDPDHLVDLIVGRATSVVHFVPPMLAELLETAGSAACGPPLRHVICSGDVLPADLVARAAALWPTTRLHNLYGPTEASIDVTWWECTVPSPADGIPLGQPIDGIEVRVVDDGLQPLPPGEVGELVIGGVGLARGYLAAPDLTAERFVAGSVVGSGSLRWYRTGDRGWQDGDGLLWFAGRADDQVKVRGARVELGEVESALRSHPEVVDAAAALCDDGRRRRLVGWAVGRGSPPSPRQLADHLAQRLPQASLPHEIVLVPAIPKTAHGKVDRAAIRERSARPALPADGPGAFDPAQRAVARLWSELLGSAVTDADLDAGLVELGGDSLLVARAVNQQRAVWGRSPSVEDLLTGATLRAVAAWLGAVPPTPPPVPRSAGADWVLGAGAASEGPASIQQEQLWITAQLDPKSTAYTIVRSLVLDGPVVADQVRRALLTLISRHGALRCRLHAGPDGLCQVITPAEGGGVHLDFAVLADHDQRAVAALGHQPLDATTALLRARLFAPDDHRPVLVLGVHHAFADGWSWGLLVDQLVDTLAGRALSTTGPQAVDHARWQRRWLAGAPAPDEAEELAQRIHRARSASPATAEAEIGAARRPAPRGPIVLPESGPSGCSELRIPAQVAAPYHQWCRSQGITLGAGFLGATAIARWRLDGTQPPVSVLGVVLAGRAQADFEQIFAMLVTTHLVLTPIAGEDTVAAVVRRAATELAAVQARSEVPLHELARRLRALEPADVSLAPIELDVVVNYNGRARTRPTGSPVRADLEVPNGHTKFDLVIDVTEQDDHLALVVERRADRYDEADVDRLVAAIGAEMAGLPSAPARPVGDAPDLVEPPIEHGGHRLWTVAP